MARKRKPEHNLKRGHLEVTTRSDPYAERDTKAQAYVYWHDCVSDAVLDGAEDAPHMAGMSRDSRKEASGSHPWAGTNTYQQALGMATSGWPEGRREAEGMAEIMEGSLGVRQEQVFRTVMAEAGARPSIPHFLAGDPECMIDYRLVNTTRLGRVVRVFVDVGGSAGFNPSTFMARAAAVLAMIETLNRQGDQVELYAGHSLWPPGGKTTSDYSMWFTLVHGAGTLLDPDALAFFCGHPAVLRRVSFALEELMPPSFLQRFGVGSSYGRSEDQLPRLKGMIEHYVEPHTGAFDIVIGSLNVGAKIRITDGAERVGSWSNANDRLDWIKTQFLDLGYELEA